MTRVLGCNQSRSFKYLYGTQSDISQIADWCRHNIHRASYALVFSFHCHNPLSLSRFFFLILLSYGLLFPAHVARG